MRIIDLSKFQDESGSSNILKTIQGLLTYGWSWQQNRKSQEELAEILETVLGNDCVLLRDVNIPKVNRPIPLVLVTPALLLVINPKSVQGFFRAEGKRWEELAEMMNIVCHRPTSFAKPGCTRKLSKVISSSIIFLPQWIAAS